METSFTEADRRELIKQSIILEKLELESTELKGWIKDEIGRIERTKADRLESSATNVKDHELRIRNLEARIFWAMGASTVLASLISFVLELILRK